MTGCSACKRITPGNKMRSFDKCTHIICKKCETIQKKKEPIWDPKLCFICPDVDKWAMKREKTTESVVSMENECAICMETIKNEKVLNCNHKFCSQCLDNWEEKSSTCPVCRQVINPDRQRQLEAMRIERRTRRRQMRLAQQDASRFPPARYKTSCPGIVLSCSLLLCSMTMFTVGVFAVENCHSLMFLGFPFWSGILLAVVAVISLIVSMKKTERASSTLLISMLILANFGFIFGITALSISIFQLDRTANGIYATTCSTENNPLHDKSTAPADHTTMILTDISLIVLSLLSTILCALILYVAMILLGCAPFSCLTRYIMKPIDSRDSSAPSNEPFFPPGVVIGTENRIEGIASGVSIIMFIVILLCGIVAFYACHAFRLLSLHIWGPILGILISCLNFNIYPDMTWCKLTTGMLANSFLILISFLMASFAGAQAAVTSNGSTFEGECTKGPYLSIDIVLIVASFLVTITTFISTKSFSNHLISPTTVSPSESSFTPRFDLQISVESTLSVESQIQIQTPTPTN